MHRPAKPGTAGAVRATAVRATAVRATAVRAATPATPARIASLIASFTGFLCCVIGSVAAIVLGAVALNQIKQTRQEGYGLAITGIVLGVGTLVVFLIIAMFSIHSR
ncbi:DUF4190 domain-containing protein [Mycobacterium interjectum]|uniref:DUF4190 domain-containing protein n=1 Tax=Mycobacterium interjectum TaxID=33895 RepID=UPI001F1C4040